MLEYKLVAHAKVLAAIRDVDASKRKNSIQFTVMEMSGTVGTWLLYQHIQKLHYKIILLQRAVRKKSIIEQILQVLMFQCCHDLCT